MYIKLITRNEILNFFRKTYSRNEALILVTNSAIYFVSKIPAGNIISKSATKVANFPGKSA